MGSCCFSPIKRKSMKPMPMQLMLQKKLMLIKPMKQIQPMQSMQPMQQMSPMQSKKLMLKQLMQQMKNTNELKAVQTTFFSREKPQTLVMVTREVSSIAQMMFDSQNNPIVWVGSLTDQNIKKGKQKIQQKIDLLIYHFPSIEKIKSSLQQNKLKSVIIIFEGELFQQGKELCEEHKQNVKQFFFCFKQNINYKYQQVKAKVNSFSADMPQKLADQIFKHKYTKNKPKILRNYMFLSKQANKLQLLIKTIHSMLNQRIDINVSQQINDHFLKLIRQIQKIDPSFTDNDTKKLFQQFLNDQKKFNDDEQVFYWYTKKSFVHVIINNLMRVSNHPCQIFIIQPFFKRLFESVKKLYIKQSKQNHKFKCYRGGWMSQEEFNQFTVNKDGVIQNLSFLSTSLSRQTAEEFKNNGNTLFIFEVEENAPGTSEYGFANIQEYSYYNQQEVLFNPLNLFDVLQVSQDHGKYLIKLRLRSTAPSSEVKQSYIFEKSLQNKVGEYKQNSAKVQIKSIQDKISENQKAIVDLQKSQRWKNECQGNALTNEYYCLKEGQEYWRLYLKIVRSKSNNESIIFKIQQIYGDFNIFYHQLNNRSYFIGPSFKWYFDLVELLGYESKISQQISADLNLDACKLFGQFDQWKIERLKNKKSSLTEIQQVQLMKKAEFKFLQFAFSSINQRIKKQKHRITKQIDLSNRKLTVEEFQQYIKSKGALQTDNNNNNRNKNANDGELQDFQWLQKLDFHNNLLKQFPIGFEKLYNLKFLNVSQNHIEEIPVGITKLNGLWRLRVFDISHNKIKQLPNSISNLIWLEHFYAQRNQIQFLPKQIGGLTYLKSLNLEANFISQLPEEISKLQNLKYLNVQCNLLIALPSNIGNLRSVQYFYASFNDLQQLSPQILQMSSLEYLYVSHNKLQKIPSDFSPLKQLKYFDVSQNSLKSIPEGFGQRSLQYLNFQGNKGLLHNTDVIKLDYNNKSSQPSFQELSEESKRLKSELIQSSKSKIFVILYLIGCIFYSMNNYQKSSQFFKECQQLNKKPSLKQTDPQYIAIISKIANVYLNELHSQQFSIHPQLQLLMSQFFTSEIIDKHRKK